MDVKLEVASGAKSGLLIPVVGDKFLIGRADDCHLKPRSELVSRYHCAILSGDAYIGVRDLGSKNGVFLNGSRVTSETEMANGDRLTVGPLEFIVRTTIESKAANKPKVESVAEAVARTVQPQGANADQEIASWLVGSGDDPLHEQETITVNYSKNIEPQNEMPAADSDADSPSGSHSASGTHGASASGTHSASGTNKADAAPTSRDAAADTLRRFFKSGR